MRITTGICGLLAAAMLSGGTALAQSEGADTSSPDTPEAATAAEEGSDTATGAGSTEPATQSAGSAEDSAGAATAGQTGTATADAGSDSPPAHSASIADADGAQLGTVDLSFAPSGLAVVDISFTGVPAGTHAVHFHQTGLCEAPFESAGDHLAGDMDHGVMAENGPHPGDMPNITVPESGEISLTYFVPGLTEGLVADEDGTAFVIHEATDDYRSQPGGDAGGRLGCAVITEAAG